MSDDTDFRLKTEREMIEDMHRLLLGSIHEGKPQKGMVTLVQEHEEILHGNRNVAGLVSDVNNLKESKIKLMAVIAMSGLGGGGLGHLVSKLLH